MNIKGLTPTIAALDPRYRTEAKDNVRLENNHERDADGKRQQGDAELKRHLSDTEFDECIKILEAIPAIVENQLIIRIETQGDSRVIFIEDLTGQVVRRLSEADLWLVTRDKERPTGRIFDRAG